MRAARDVALLVLVALAIAMALSLFRAATVRAACIRVGPDHPDVRAGWNPSRWQGCTVYGSGDASVWSGPGVARNDCLWPWTDCTPIAITSIDTGRTVVIRPTMFCDCYLGQHTGTYRERLVDLDPATLRALGLPTTPRLYPVTVAPAVRSTIEGSPPADTLPDTAVR